MTYLFVETIMKNVEMDYFQLTMLNNKVNPFLNIQSASIEVYQRVEDYQMNHIIIKTRRKNNYCQLKKVLVGKTNLDIYNKIIDEFLYPYDRIVVKIDVHYDPLQYSSNHFPVWKLCEIQLTGLNSNIVEGIKHMIEEQNFAICQVFYPSLCLRNDISYFMSKFCKLLKRI